MAGGRDFYSVERCGHRDGYVMADVDGLVLGDEKSRNEDGEEWVWEGCPEVLETGVDVDDVWRRWRSALPVSFESFTYYIPPFCKAMVIKAMMI